MRQFFRIAIRKAKRLLELAFYLPLDKAVLLTCKKGQRLNSIAIVHVELLGDYILWRPYGRHLCDYLRSFGLNVTLIVNEQISSLARRDFNEHQIIGVSRTCFLNNLYYRSMMLRQLAELRPERTIHYSSPRDALIGDAIIRALGGNTIGFDSIHTDRSLLDKILHQQLYSRLVDASGNTHLSFHHMAMLKALDISTEKFNSIYLLSNHCPPPISAPYFIIAPGGSQQFRRWPISQFIVLAKLVLKRHGDWKVVVLGTKDEVHLGEDIVETLGDSAINIVGKTTIDELHNWVAHARLLLGNDSAAGHLAAAIGTPSLLAIGGGHFGRCFPYPPSNIQIKFAPRVVAHKMPCFGCDWNCIYKMSENLPVPCIAEISVESALDELNRLLETVGERSRI